MIGPMIGPDRPKLAILAIDSAGPMIDRGSNDNCGPILAPKLLPIIGRRKLLPESSQRPFKFINNPTIKFKTWRIINSN